jgi:copper(I)-binding protein
MRLIVATLAVCALLSGCNSEPTEGGVAVENAMIHLPAVKGRPGSAYFTLQGAGDSTRLLSVSSPSIEKIELHDSVTTGGVARMQKVESLTFDDRLELKPGGKHAMLFGLDPALKPGAQIPLTFTFRSGRPVTVQAQVLGPGGGHAGH